MARSTGLREILVGIRADQERELNRLAQESQMSRAAVIRHAIDALLARRRQSASADAFGLWGHGSQDGLVYERELRGEW